MQKVEVEFYLLKTSSLLDLVVVLLRSLSGLQLAKDLSRGNEKMQGEFQQGLGPS